MMKYNIHEAAAAVAANHTMTRRDVFDIVRLALSMMIICSAVVTLL